MIRYGWTLALKDITLDIEQRELIFVSAITANTVRFAFYSSNMEYAGKRLTVLYKMNTFSKFVNHMKWLKKGV